MELCSTTWVNIGFGLLVAMIAGFIAGGSMAIVGAGGKSAMAWLCLMIVLAVAELYVSNALIHARACEFQSHD